MPLVVARDGTPLALAPPADASSPVVPTKIGRALAPRLGLARDEEVKVSRVQCEVTPLGADGATLRVTSLGANPTPWFPSGREGLAGSEDGTSEPSKRLLRKGESAVLRDGDGLGLCQTDAPPGALRFQSARAARMLGPEALFDVDARNTKRARDEAEDPMNRCVKTDRTNANVFEPPSSKPTKPIVLVLSGAPGSGKSTFCASLPCDAWTIVNQDTAGKNGKPGTRQQCVERVISALAIKRNVAIDRCGLTLEQRETFVRLAFERGAEAHALWLDLPRELLFERLRNRTNHPTVRDGGGVGVCKRMLGAKANAPPDKMEGFARVTRCANEWDVERALAGYRRVTNVASGGGGGGDEKSVGGAEFPKADGAAATLAKPASPNAFAVMMGAAKANAKTPPGSAKKQTPASASASKPFGGGSWRDALSAMAADPATHAGGSGAVVFFDDELVVAKDAYPKSRTHLLVLARDTRLAEGPKALRSSDAPLVRRMMRAGLECARKLVQKQKNASETAEDDFDDFVGKRFRCGFHASPSMRTAHMHVVSLDLRGSGMKTRRHWNSFATSFFKEAEETAIRLETEKKKLDWDVVELERVVAMTPLRCHKCGDGPFNTMPKLFAHCDKCDKEGFSVRTDSSL